MKWPEGSKATYALAMIDIIMNCISDSVWEEHGSNKGSYDW
ncbi:hypothetical protein [uncultured Phocaeicola sp.]|nr:hypothetical protein [uncultured Phocaeicola sp.]